MVLATFCYSFFQQPVQLKIPSLNRKSTLTNQLNSEQQFLNVHACSSLFVLLVLIARNFTAATYTHGGIPPSGSVQTTIGHILFLKIKNDHFNKADGVRSGNELLLMYNNHGSGQTISVNPRFICRLVIEVCRGFGLNNRGDMVIMIKSECHR